MDDLTTFPVFVFLFLTRKLNEITTAYLDADHKSSTYNKVRERFGAESEVIRDLLGGAPNASRYFLDWRLSEVGREIDRLTLAPIPRPTKVRAERLRKLRFATIRLRFLEDLKFDWSEALRQAGDAA